MLCAYQPTAFAQARLVHREAMSMDAQQGDWFWNTEIQEILMFRGDDRALLRNDRCTKAEAWHGFVIIELDGERWELLDSTGAQAGPQKPIKGRVRFHEGLIIDENSWSLPRTKWNLAHRTEI